MENNMKKLSKEELKKISGGAWDPDTITPEESAEYYKVIDEVFGSPKKSDAEIRASMEKLYEFCRRMNAKYGCD